MRDTPFVVVVEAIQENDRKQRVGSLKLDGSPMETVTMLIEVDVTREQLV